MPNLTINNGGITTNSKSLPNIDLRYGPYDSLDAAYNTLSEVLVPGLVIGVIGDGGKITEYQAQKMGDEIEFVSKEIRISYNDLDDLPKINNIELNGNKTASDLGLATSTQGGKADTAIQTLSIGTTTTGNAGTQANVTNSGTQTNPILNFTIPRGDPGIDAVNPFKGYYSSGVSKPATGTVGDYLYAPPSDSQSTATATIWHYDSTQTPPWTDTEIDVSAVVALEFGSGQAVTATKIKDENGEEVQGAADVLSAEAGKNLNEQLNGVPSNIASNGYMDTEGVMHAVSVNTYETSVFIPIKIEVGDVLEFTVNEIDAQGRLCFFQSNTETSSDPENNKATEYFSLNATPRTVNITASYPNVLAAHYMRICWKTVNRDNVYIKLNGNTIYRPTTGTEGEFVRKEEFTQELGDINQNIGTKSQDSDLEADNLWDAVDEVNEKSNSEYVEIELTSEKVDYIRVSGDYPIIESNSNSKLRYVHLNAGEYIKVVIGNGSISRWRWGFTAQVPAINVAVTDDDVKDSPTNFTALDTTVESECYVCVSTSSTYIDYCTFYTKKSLKDKIEILEGNIANIEEDIANIQYNIPSIEKKFIQSKCANANNRSKCFTLLHFSDLHGGKSNLSRIIAFKQQWQDYINDAICTGDNVSTDITSSNLFDPTNQNYVSGANSILLCTGNHDTKSELGIAVSYWYQHADSEQVYNRIMGNKSNWGTIVQPTGAGESGYYPCYYYKDYANAGVRLVVLDMMSLGKAILNNNNSLENLDNTQITWFQNTLASAKTAGLHVVIAQHFPFISEGMYNVENNANVLESDFSIPNGEYTYSSGGIDEQISRRALPYLSGLIEDFKNYGGIFVCWICGHTHYDLLQETLGNKQKVVVIATATYNASDQRTIRNTTDESMDLFNIFSVDTINRVVKIFRVGSHLTPALQKIDTMCFAY